MSHKRYFFLTNENILTVCTNHLLLEPRVCFLGNDSEDDESS